MSATTPWFKSKAFYAALVSIVTGLPSLIQQLQILPLGLPTWAVHALAIVSVIALWATPMLNRHATEEAVKVVDAKADVAVAVSTEAAQKVAGSL